MAITHFGNKMLKGTKADRVSDSLGSSGNGGNSGVTLISGIKDYAGFDGSNDYINLGGSASDWNLFHAPSGSCEYSVSMWIKLDTVQYTQIFTTEDNSEQNGVVMYVNSATQVGIQTWYGGSQHSTTITTSTWEAGKWYHLVITRNGGTYKIYKDGTEYTGSSSATGNTNDASYVPRISGNHGQTNYRLDGGVSQVIVYTDQLTQSEVTELYNSGTPVSDPTTLGSDGGSIKAWYKFESDANDSHGSLNGTATGVTWISDAFKLGSGAYSFDGSNDSVTFGSASDWEFLSDGSSWSIAWWQKCNAIGVTEQIFNTHDDSSGSNKGMGIYQHSSNKIGLSTYNGTAGQYPFSHEIVSDFWADTDWHHIAVVYDSSDEKAHIYKDGSLKISQSKNSASFAAGAPQGALKVGERVSANNRDLNSTLDDIGIWNRVLTATEISDLVNAPNSWWVGGTSKNVTTDGNTVTTGSGSAWANWVHGKAVTAPTTLEFSVDDTNTNCIVGFGTGTGADSPSAGSPMKHCVYLTSGGDIFWSDSTGETDTGSNRAAGDTYKLVWQSNGNLDLYLKPSGGSYGSSLKSWTSVTGTLYPMVQGYSGIVVTMLPTATVDGALVSSLSDKSGLKANYTMDSTSIAESSALTGFTKMGSSNKVSESNGTISYTIDGSSQSSGVYKELPGAAGSSWILKYKLTITTDDISLSSGQACNHTVGVTDTASGVGEDPSSSSISSYLKHAYHANKAADYWANGGSNGNNWSNGITVNQGAATFYVTHTCDNGSVTTRYGTSSDYTGGSVTPAWTINSTARDGQKKYVFFNAFSQGVSSGSVVGTVSDIKFTPQSNCANDASSTSDLEAMTNLPTNTIFLQTDDTPSYWWKQSDNTWVKEKYLITEEWDFSNSTNWVLSDSSDVTIANGVLNIQCNDNSVTRTALFDLENILGSGGRAGDTWVLRWKWNLTGYTNTTSGQGVGYSVGIWNATPSGWNTGTTGLDARCSTHGAGANATYHPQVFVSGSRTDSSSSSFSQSSMGTRYCELVKDASNLTLKVYTTSDFSGSPEHTVVRSYTQSQHTGGRYIGYRMVNEAVSQTNNISIDDFKFYNNMTSV